MVNLRPSVRRVPNGRECVTKSFAVTVIIAFIVLLTYYLNDLNQTYQRLAVRQKYNVTTYGTLITQGVLQPTAGDGCDLSSVCQVYVDMVGCTCNQSVVLLYPARD